MRVSKAVNNCNIRAKIQSSIPDYLLLSSFYLLRDMAVICVVSSSLKYETVKKIISFYAAIVSHNDDKRK